MVEAFRGLLAVIIGYALGALPMGYFVVRLFKKQDITKIGSGRTGGTNALRAGGIGVGLSTAVLDLAKGYLAVSVSRLLTGSNHWVEVLAGMASVFGHNWSLWLFLMTKKFSAGAGTGPNIGAATAFWWPVLPIMAPTVAFFVLVVGYGSVASLVAAVGLPVIFLIRFLAAGAPWQYVIYGLMTTVFVAWALRPNIERLLNGTERRVGIFARKKTE